jgi:UMP-CMP kinase
MLTSLHFLVTSSVPAPHQGLCAGAKNGQVLRWLSHDSSHSPALSKSPHPPLILPATKGGEILVIASGIRRLGGSSTRASSVTIQSTTSLSATPRPRMGCGSSHEAVNPRMNSARPPTPPPKIKATIVFVEGPPAVGKGTQCALIKGRFSKYIHLSMGDLLRDYVTMGTPLGQRIADTISEGRLVSDELVLELLRDAIDSTQGSHRHFLIDGFPRTLDQAMAFERVIGTPAFVLSLNATDDVVKKRVQGHKRVLAHVDDGHAAFLARLVTFKSQTVPVIEHYRAAGIVHDIDAGRHAEAVFADIAPIFEQVCPGILFYPPSCEPDRRMLLARMPLLFSRACSNSYKLPVRGRAAAFHTPIERSTTPQLPGPPSSLRRAPVRTWCPVTRQLPPSPLCLSSHRQRLARAPSALRSRKRSGCTTSPRVSSCGQRLRRDRRSASRCALWRRRLCVCVCGWVCVCGGGGGGWGC